MNRKNFSAIAWGFTCGVIFFAAKAFAIDNPPVNWNPRIVNETAVASTKTFTIDVNEKQVARLSAFVSYSTASVPAVSFSDGRTSTAAITISSLTAISSAAANAYLAITSNTALANGFFRLVTPAGSYLFREGVDWSKSNFSTATNQQNFSTRTAVSIAATLNFSSYGVTAVTATVSGNAGVLVTARQKGTIGNSYALASSTPAALTTTTFTNGRDLLVLKINGVQFRAGYEYSALATASGTARNLSNAIATSSLVGYVSSTFSTVASVGIVYATSSYVNMSTYTVFSSSNGAMAISSVAASYSDGSALGYFVGGQPSNISVADNVISTPNALTQGLAVLYSSSVGSSPAPLRSGTTYFVVNSSVTQFQLAYTATGAAVGLVIDITSVTQRGGGSFTVAPLAYNASAPQPSYKWEVSNDSATWVDLTGSFTTNFTSVTAHNFGDFNWRYLRQNVTSSSNTPVNINTWLNGKP